MRGRPVAGGLIFIPSQIVGDLKWIKEMFQFPHFYGAKECCWFCKRTKDSSDILCAYDFSQFPPWMYARRSHFIYMIETGQCILWCRLPGWHLSMLQIDLLHILMLGVLQWCCGPIFYELLEANYWGAPPGGRWQARWAYQLAIAYSQFVAWCRQNSVKTYRR